MIYKVEVLLPNGPPLVMYEGPNKKAADDAFAITSGCGYTREYYEGTISWERTKSILS